jgi:hypothetical protein
MAGDGAGDVVVISATVVTKNPDHVAKAAEVLARAAAGLALEGIDVSLSFGIPEDDEPDGETDG